MTFGTIYAARKSSQVGMSGNEVEASKAATADWTAVTKYMNEMVDRQDRKIEKLEIQVSDLRDRVSSDSSYIDRLRNHINLGFGPPAPTREEN